MPPSRDHHPSEFLPSEPIPVVRFNPQTRQRELVRLQWGLVPSGTDPQSHSSRLIHARAETVATKPAFHDSFRRRRCLLVVDSFDVGKGHDEHRSHVIQRKDHRPFGVGAIWDRWQEDDNAPVESCAVITTLANDLVQPFNERMPLIIAEEDYYCWLDPEFFNLPELERMMQPFPPDMMTVRSVKAVREG